LGVSEIAISRIAISEISIDDLSVAEILRISEKLGAGDEIRTRDPQLGRLML
jgi:hypothetical protein